MPPKKRFASRADEALQQRKAGLMNAAKRRLGNGANQPGAKFAGRVSGSGMSGSQGFAPNKRGSFTPRTATGRPASAVAAKLGEFGNLNKPQGKPTDPKKALPTR